MCMNLVPFHDVALPVYDQVRVTPLTDTHAALQTNPRLQQTVLPVSIVVQHHQLFAAARHDVSD